MASAAKVELDIFSGRENPSWSLDEDRAAQLAALVRALPRAAVRRTNGDELRDPDRQIEKFLWSSMPPDLRREFKDLVPGAP